MNTALVLCLVLIIGGLARAIWRFSTGRKGNKEFHEAYEEFKKAKEEHEADPWLKQTIEELDKRVRSHQRPGTATARSRA